MSDTQDGVVRVATVFTAAEFAVTASYLEGNGILVASMPFHFLNNMPHYANAIDGAGVMVPKRQAQAAINLLLEAERGEKQSGMKRPNPLSPNRSPGKTAG